MIFILFNISAFSFGSGFKGEQRSRSVDFLFDDIELDEGEETRAIVLFVIQDRLQVGSTILGQFVVDTSMN